MQRPRPQFLGLCIDARSLWPGNGRILGYRGFIRDGECPSAAAGPSQWGYAGRVSYRISLCGPRGAVGYAPAWMEDLLFPWCASSCSRSLTHMACTRITGMERAKNWICEGDPCCRDPAWETLSLSARSYVSN